jgi:hypothetical protein
MLLDENVLCLLKRSHRRSRGALADGMIYWRGLANESRAGRPILAVKPSPTRAARERRRE